MKNKKVLFISPVPELGAGFRARIGQYLPYLEKENINFTCRPFMSNDFFKIVYKPGRKIKKIFYFLQCTFRRLFDIFSFPFYDSIFIYREAFPFGPPLIERIIRVLGVPIIYDIDDAIFMPNPNVKEPKLIKRLKYYKKADEIIRMSSCVIVCNDYLKDYVKRINPKVEMIPTPVETKIFKPREKDGPRSVSVIGWIGTHTTFPYFEKIRNVFLRLSKKNDFVLKIVGAGKDFFADGLRVINKEWSLRDDLSDFQSLDIGVYPLGGNEFDLGKTGYKTVQYMSVGVATVASNVGRNKEIIKDGINGFLAETEDEWVKKLELLIRDSELRKKVGLEARKTVEQVYSVEINAPKLIRVFNQVHNSRKCRMR